MSGTTQMTPPPVAPARPLRRSNNDRIIGGVCGGLARNWNIDPIILRVAFAVSILVGAFGLLVYLGLWLLVPDDSAPPTQRYNPFWLRRVTAVLLFVIAAFVLLGVLFGGSELGVLVAAVLAGAGVWIYMSQRDRQLPVGEEPAVGFAYEGTVTSQLPPGPVEPYERSYLGLIGLLAAMVAAGLAVLLGGGPTVVLASSLLALGVTMIVGGFRGRTKWLLIFVVPLLMLTALVSQVERADITAGEVPWRPTPQDTSYELTLGDLDVDFSDWGSAPKVSDRVSMSVGGGTLVVAVPRNWDVRLVSDVRAGSVRVDGENVQPSATTVIPARSRADGAITLAVTVGIGDVVIVTDAPPVGKPSNEQDDKQVDKKDKKKEKSA